jgi:hypothetical protein
VDQSWYQRFLPSQIQSEIIQEEELEESPKNDESSLS